MSYDLLSFACPEGVEPGDAYDKLMEAEEARLDSGVTEPPATAEMVALAHSLRSTVSDLSGAHPAPFNGGLELAGEALSVAISPETVEINVPYWGRLDGSHFIDDLTAVVARAREAGHDTLFDPQLDRAVDPVTDRDALIDMFEQGLAIVAGLAPDDKPVSPAAVPSAPAPTEAPTGEGFFKRLFGPHEKH